MSFWFPLTWKKAGLFAVVLALEGFLVYEFSTIRVVPKYADTAQIYLCGRSSMGEATDTFVVTEYEDLAVCGGVDGHLVGDSVVGIVWRHAEGKQYLAELVNPVWLDQNAGWAHFRADPQDTERFVAGEYVVELVHGREILKTLRITYQP